VANWEPTPDINGKANPKGATMAAVPVLQPDVTVLGKKAFTTPCSCQRSMLVLQMPMVHCPACHATYRARQLTPPTRCARCDFNLWKWRLRLGIQIPEIGVAI
jgi:hypothetical protein